MTSPTSTVDLHYGAATDVGRVRTVNEDSFLASPPVFVVADGMGGHEGGDVASRIVVEEFEALADSTHDARSGAAAVAEVFERCQARIHEYAAEQRSSSADRWYAGTTAVVALLVVEGGEPHWLLANLGDSRVYRLGDGEFEQVSVDHSVVQELLDAGTISAGEVATHPERHVVTRALGGPDDAEADYFLLPLPSVERLLLCSDGINGMIDDAAIEVILREADDPRDAAERLVAAALEAGGRDNATAVVVDVVGWLTDDTRGAGSGTDSLEHEPGAAP